MARLFYGHSGAEVVATPQAVELDLQLNTTNVYWAYTARISGTRHTDLLSRTGSAITTISPDSDGRIIFQGVDGYTDSYWLEDQADTSKPRWLVEPVDLASRVGGVTVHGNLTGLASDDHTQYQLETGKNAANGYAGLDGSTKLTFSHLPTGTTSTTVSLGNHTHTGTAGDHGTLIGLGDNDHPQYSLATHTHTGTAGDHGTLVGLADNDHPQYSLTSGNIRQFADVDDAVPADGNVLEWESTDSLYHPISLAGRYAGVGADGRLASAANPQYYVPTIVINEGGTVPATFPTGGIVLVRAAPATSIVPVTIGGNTSEGTTTVAVTTSTSVSVGEYVILGAGASGEAPTPTTYTVAFSTGAAAMSSATNSVQAGTAQSNILVGRCTTAIPSGATITVTASAAKNELMMSVGKAASLVTSGVVDQTAINSAGSSSAAAAANLTAGPTGTTAQANELAIGMFTFNPAVVTIAPAGVWSALGPTYTSGAVVTASTRAARLFYRVLTATQTVTAQATLTSSDGTYPAWSGALATLRAA